MADASIYIRTPKFYRSANCVNAQAGRYGLSLIPGLIEAAAVTTLYHFAYLQRTGQDVASIRTKKDWRSENVNTIYASSNPEAHDEGLAMKKQ